jgi:hypothetical protein
MSTTDSGDMRRGRARLGEVLRSFASAILYAVFALLLGAIVGVATGLLYFFDLFGDGAVSSFFSSATGVTTGVLLALIVNGFARQASSQTRRDIAGTVAIASLGTFAALIGQLAADHVLRGVCFAVACGGLSAGIFGLVFFLREPVEPLIVKPVAGGPKIAGNAK